MFEAVDELMVEHADLETKMSDPGVHANAGLARSLGRRYAQLTPIVETYLRWRTLGEDLEAARELGDTDASFRAEMPDLERRRDEAAEELRALLVPRDPNDGKDVIVEVKAGEGGEESALFAGDLLRMYLRYAERQGWKTELLDATESDLGGYRDATLAVRAGTGDGAWSRLKFEGGVHRVQRVPVTESQGRIHTSAAGVLVLPEAEEVDVEIDPPTCASTSTGRVARAGRASTPLTPPSASPTCRPAPSCRARTRRASCRTRSRRCAFCASRLLVLAQEEAAAAASAERRIQIRTVDRSERIRTYNYPENRISDHRVNFKAYNLDQVLDGDLDAVIQSLVDADAATRMAEHSS